MIKPGDIVDSVEIIKTDNINDTGYEGYEISLNISGQDVYFILYTIDELEDEPLGVYNYDGTKYIQLENWEE